MRSVRLVASLCPWLVVAAGLSASGAESTAPVERIVKKDGTTVEGEITGFERGNYTVRVGESEVQIPALDVKTIEQDGLVPPPARPAPRGGFGVAEVLEALARRTNPRAAPESVATFHDAVASVLRSEWDFALGILRRLFDGEPGWPDPQILHGIVLLEQGDFEGALKIALRLETCFGEDTLALRVAAEAARRNGFADHHARVMARALSAEAPGERFDHEMARLFWPIDPARAREHWLRCRESDPTLGAPWCQEGATVRKAKAALALEDWFTAQGAVDEMVLRFPWMVEEAREIRTEILASRLHSAEAHGQLEVALLAAASLRELAPERAADWDGKLHTLRTALFQDGMRHEGIAEFRRWCVQNLHLFTSAASDVWRPRVSARYQTLGLAALARGEVDSARIALRAAREVDARVRPEGFDESWAGCVDRVRTELELDRRQAATNIAALLGECYPEHVERLEGEVARVFRAASESEFPLGVLASDAAAPALAVVATDPGRGQRPPLSAEERRHLAEQARPTLARYFPHDTGTVWVYRRGDGTRETRRVTSVTPCADGGTKVTFQVREEAAEAGPATEVCAYFTGSDLTLLDERVPPGEYVLRFPLSDNAEWSWSHESFRYTRRVRRPAAPLQLPMGTYRDYVVVEAENTIESPDTGGAISARTTVTWVAGLGLARIESENESISRVLVEFRAAGPR